MSARREAMLWATQRVTAAVLAFCVAVHLFVIIYAVRQGLSAEHILGRTRGNFAWGLFYGLFVVAAALHGAIGLRAVATEWLRLRREAVEVLTTLVAVGLTMLGLRAVAGVIGA